MYNEISQVPWDKLGSPEKKQWTNLSQEAASDPFIGGKWFRAAFLNESTVNNLKNKPVCIFEKHKLVGFFTPYLEEADEGSCWRSGVLFLSQKSRGKGIMRKVLTEFFSKHLPASTLINDDNFGSIKLFTSIGFVETEVYPVGVDNDTNSTIRRYELRSIGKQSAAMLSFQEPVVAAWR